MISRLKSIAKDIERFFLSLFLDQIHVAFHYFTKTDVNSRSCFSGYIVRECKIILAAVLRENQDAGVYQVNQNA